MPTIQENISIGRISTYLSSQDADKADFYGARLYPNLPKLIAMETDSISWAFAENPNDATLDFTAKYLYSLCGKYAPSAFSIIAGGGGSPIPGVYSSGYEYYVIEDTIAADNTVYYNQKLIGGKDVKYMFIDNQYTPIADANFNKTTGVITGIFFAGNTITIPFNRKL